MNTIQVGDVVIYTCEFDSDKSYSPNVGPATVAKINSDGSLDLVVMTLNGVFFKTSSVQGSDRGTWHVRNP